MDLMALILILKERLLAGGVGGEMMAINLEKLSKKGDDVYLSFWIWNQP